MAKFKQEQIIAGVTKTRSNAVKVYCSGAVAKNDLISVVGAQGDFLSVSPADANGAVTLNNSQLYVADFAGASGTISVPVVSDLLPNDVIYVWIERTIEKGAENFDNNDIVLNIRYSVSE